jgi:hypothetical protein
MLGWLFEGVNWGSGVGHRLEKVGVGLWMGAAWMPRGLNVSG